MGAYKKIKAFVGELSSVKRGANLRETLMLKEDNRENIEAVWDAVCCEEYADLERRLEKMESFSGLDDKQAACGFAAVRSLKAMGKSDDEIVAAFVVPEIESPEMHVAEKSLMEGEGYNELYEKLRSAVVSEYGDDWWISDVYEGYLVIEGGPKREYMKAMYTRGADGSVAIGDTMKVERVVTYKQEQTESEESESVLEKSQEDERETEMEQEKYEELAKELDAAKGEKEALAKELDALKADAERAVMLAKAAELDALPGTVEEKADILAKVKAALGDDSETVSEFLKAANEQAKSGALFKAAGVDGDPEANSAVVAKVDADAKTLAKEKGISFEIARAQILGKDRELSKSYYTEKDGE